jgi:hypothetical protein
MLVDSDIEHGQQLVGHGPQAFVEIVEELLFCKVHRVTAWLYLFGSADLSTWQRMSQAGYIQYGYSNAILQHPAINQFT